jgi:uncharacterized protein
MVMSQTVLIKGKNVLEAIELGLNLLESKKEEVYIEVIQQEKEGFLRLGSKKAVVKLTKITPHPNLEKKLSVLPFEKVKVWANSLISDKSDNDTELKLSSHFKLTKKDMELEGKVWVEDGQIFSKPSTFSDTTITVGNGVQLYKNGKQVFGTVNVIKDDQFELKTMVETIETKWDIHIDENYLNVWLYVQPGIRRTFKVMDVTPDTHIKVEGKEFVEVTNELEYQEIVAKLNELKIIHRLNHTEIKRAVKTEVEGRFNIASGIKPKDGENGKIEFLVDTEKKMGLKQRTNELNHSSDVQVIPSVQRGQVLALIHPPSHGSDGYTITNEPISPTPANPVIVHPGKGINLIENGTKMVATESGRAVIEQKGLIANVFIIPKLTHPSDVNVSSGNIHFKGDVEIVGNVDEGMEVEAEGEVVVYQNAYVSSISANHSVSIRGNAIGSTISAGKRDLLIAEMIQLLLNIQMEKKRLILSIQQIMNIPAFKMSDYYEKGLLPLIKLLLEQKFKVLLKYVKQFIEITDKNRKIVDIEWLTLAEQLRLCFLTSILNEYHTIENMSSLLTNIGEMIEDYQVDERDTKVNLRYALNSTIFSAGDAHIHGQGCFNTNIHSEGIITINGVFRGGKLYSKSEVHIKEADTIGGVVSKIIVPSNGKIHIRLAREGTMIQIGEALHIFQRDQSNINAKLDERGKLVY